jgi:hypothetical protein
MPILYEIKALDTCNFVRILGEHLALDANSTPISSRIEAEIVLCDAEEMFPEMKFEIRKFEL